MTCPNTPKATFRPLSALQHPREVIRQFTPNWFAATMGTGVLALALASLPVQIPGMYAVAEGLWLFNIGLFILFSVLYGARWVLYFDEARRIFGHSTVSMFFGTIPMGLATIINGFLLFGVARWGSGMVQVAGSVVVARCGHVAGIRGDDSLHDVHPSGAQHRPNDCGLAVTRGGGWKWRPPVVGSWRRT